MEATPSQYSNPSILGPILPLTSAVPATKDSGKAFEEKVVTKPIHVSQARRPGCGAVWTLPKIVVLKKH